MNTTLEKEIITGYKTGTSRFLHDVINGLSAKEKYLQSKYFYDAKGDKLFQKIMACPEYYLTKCEMEIFSKQTNELASTLTKFLDEFDVVELGAGDASKSIHLLDELLKYKFDFKYYPIDISNNVIKYLEQNLAGQLPSLQMQGLNGEYFPMLSELKKISGKVKVVLFLGSNIGNVPLEEAQAFCSALRSNLSVGDLALIGFDLKKDPAVILNAYNDRTGYTRDFNLNLLHRINDELGADFKIENFKHVPHYNPNTGACRSYLESLVEHKVLVDQKVFSFAKGEKLDMEISQKYSVTQTDELANSSGFIPLKHFYDTKRWFLDAVWQCI